MPAFYFEFLYYIAVRHCRCCCFFCDCYCSLDDKTAEHTFTLTHNRSGAINFGIDELFYGSLLLPLFYLCIYILISKCHIDGDDNDDDDDDKKQLHGRIVIFSPAKSHKMATKFSVVCSFFFRSPFFVGRFLHLFTFFFEHERKKLQLEFRDDEDNTNPTHCLDGMKRGTYVAMHFLSAKDE